MLFKPTPEEQVSHLQDTDILHTSDGTKKRKCSALIRSNTRKLDRDISQLRALESKTKNLILAANKRGQRNPNQAKSAAKESRTFAKELIKQRKQSARLATSRAQLQSVSMQVNEAFSVRKIQGSLKTSTEIMKDVNTLVKLPELTGTMRELSQELVKAGIIEEMVEDALPDSELMEGEDDEAEAEVDKVLGEILKDRLPAEKVSQQPIAPEPAPVAEDDDEDQEELLDQMRGRLEALKS